eukprot:gene15237-10896_t
MLSDLQQLDIILHNDNHIDAGIVSQELCKLNANLETMANLKNEMGSAGELRVPRGLFAALDKKKETSLDGFERQLMKDAVEKGDDIRRRAKLRQDMALRMQEEVNKVVQR